MHGIERFQMTKALRSTVFKYSVNLCWILAKETVAKPIGGIRRSIMEDNICY